MRTPEERELWIAEELAKLKRSVDGNECCVCGGIIGKKVQVGRCVYAEPCGHRLYQGFINPQPEEK